MSKPLSIALTLWEIGLLSEDKLTTWVEFQILAQEKPAHDLLEIVGRGVVCCLKEGLITTQPLSLNFSEQFSLRVYYLDLSCDRAVQAFIHWVIQNCTGDPALPEVSLGYQLEHLAVDCDNMIAAMALLQIKLPELMSQCRDFASTFLGEVSDLKLCI